MSEQQIHLCYKTIRYLLVTFQIFVPLRKETSIGVCAVKLNLAFAAPSMLRSFFERVLTWCPEIFDKHFHMVSDTFSDGKKTFQK